MKILFAIKALEDAHGGAERVLSQVASGLAARGHDVSLLSFDQSDFEPFYPLSDKVKRISICAGNIKSKATLPKFFHKIFIVRKVVNELQPDCVIGFMHSTFIPAAFGMIGTGVPLIASEHIVPEHYKNRKKEYFLFLLSLPFIRKITVLSQEVLESYSSVFHSRMSAITNPVLRAKEIADTVGVALETKTILNVGRLEEQKDHETLIRAFALVAHDYPNWKLTIIGEGQLRPKLERLVVELKMEKRIYMPGVTAKISAEYSSAHIFALSSKYESFGLATAEAMAHGLPTLGFASCPGTNELIIHNHNGLLIEDSDNRSVAFANGLKTLMGAPKLRKKFGYQGIRAIRRFHPDIIIRNWEELIASVV